MSIDTRICSLFASSPPDFLQQPYIGQTRYLSNGICQAWTGETIVVQSPLTPSPIGVYPSLSEKEALEILQSSKSAWKNGQSQWALAAMGERIERLEHFLQKMKEKRLEVARLIMWEIAKSWTDAQKEFDRTIRYIELTIERLKELDRDSSRLLLEGGYIAQIRRMPLGVALCMGPYNYPLNETFATLIPAIAMGNAAILKPPRIGVLLYEPLLSAFAESFPAGVINTVYGDGARVITPIMSSGAVDVLAFIGSSRTADALKKEHPKPHRLRAALGLEAKNVAIVSASANLDVAVEQCIIGALSYNGQRCTAIKMILVDQTRSEQFLQRLVDAVDQVPFGMPWDEGVLVTPLPDMASIQRMQALLGDAVEKGAKILNRHGGKTQGTFFFPAVLYPVLPSMRLYHEEQFGPLIPIADFRDPQEAIDYIVHSPYGQQASLFGENAKTIAHFTDALVNQVCRININAECQRSPDTFPFNGRKDSAEGTLSVFDALRTLSIRTIVATPHTKNNAELIQTILREQESSFISTRFLL